jgi:uncharacterized protein (TIGR03545 family)
MKQLFRWSGLLPFIIVSALLAAFWLLLADTLLKQTIESLGSDLVGAEVNLNKAELTLDPLQIRLLRLQVTDPEQPQHNMVELAEAVASLEPWKLLMGQVIINEMSITGLQVDTPRSRPGRLQPQEKPTDTKEAEEGTPSTLTQLQGALPSVQSVLQQEPLLLTSRNEALQSHYAERRAALDALLAKLPDEQQRQQLQQRFTRATQGQPKTVEEFNTQKTELEKVQTELRTIKSTLEQSRDQLAQSREQLVGDLAALKAAPGEDLKRLREKYSLDTQGAMNMSGLLFGDKVEGWMAQALQWYQRIEPMLGASSDKKEEEAKPQRASGRYVRFPSANPTPDFLLRKARVQLSLPIGDIDSELHDLTHQPQIIGRPATLSATASRLQGLQSLDLKGRFDHRETATAEDTLALQLKGLQLTEMALSQSSDFPLSLAQAAADMQGNLTLSGGQIEAKMKGVFNHARFLAGAKEGLAGELAESLAGIDNFSIDATAHGTLAAPEFSLSSDLDKQLNKQFQQRLKAKQAAFEQQLRTALEERIAGPRSEYEGKMAQLTQLQSQLDSQLSENQKMLQAKLDSFKGQADKQLEESGKQQLGDKLKGLKF